MPQPRRRIWLWAAVLVAGLLLALTTLTACTSGSSEHPGDTDVGSGETNTSSGPPDTSEDSGGAENSGGGSGGLGRSEGADQVAFINKAARDRKGLFDGQLAYDPPIPVNVNDTTQFTAELSALSSDQPPPDHIVARRNLRVGGVQGAELTAPDGDVDIALDGSNHQLLTRDNTVVWQWELTPRTPGHHRLSLVVETYQGSTTNVLERTKPPITVELTAKNTFAYRLGEMKNWLIAAGSIIGATGVIFAFFRRPLFALFARITGRPPKGPDKS